MGHLGLKPRGAQPVFFKSIIQTAGWLAGWLSQPSRMPTRLHLHEKLDPIISEFRQQREFLDLLALLASQEKKIINLILVEFS